MRKTLLLPALAGLVLLAGCVSPGRTTGRADYAQFCAGCHGVSGKGDGPAAAGLAVRPPDLTGLSTRNGGTYPLAYVMTVIDGYTRRDQHGSLMPGFGPLLEGRMVLVDTGDGIPTPTPERLVALAEYLESLQD